MIGTITFIARTRSCLTINTCALYVVSIFKSLSNISHYYRMIQRKRFEICLIGTIFGEMKYPYLLNRSFIFESRWNNFQLLIRATVKSVRQTFLKINIYFWKYSFYCVLSVYWLSNFLACSISIFTHHFQTSKVRTHF